MNYLSEGSNVSIGKTALLDIAYRPSDSGVGLLVIRSVDESSKEIKIRLDRWSPEGFRSELWEQYDLLVVCGATGVAVIHLATLNLVASFSFEHLECESVGFPYFVKDRERFLIVTETRIICIQRQGYICWFWSVRESSTPHWKIGGVPTIRKTFIEVPLTSFKHTAHIELELNTGFSLIAPQNWKT